MAIPQKQKRDILCTISGFAAAGILAAGLIFLGNRNDAVSEAERLKAGILTAHEVKAAFQSVGGPARGAPRNGRSARSRGRSSSRH